MTLNNYYLNLIQKKMNKKTELLDCEKPNKPLPFEMLIRFWEWLEKRKNEKNK